MERIGDGVCMEWSADGKEGELHNRTPPVNKSVV